MSDRQMIPQSYPMWIRLVTGTQDHKNVEYLPIVGWVADKIATDSWTPIVIDGMGTGVSPFAEEPESEGELILDWSITDDRITPEDLR